MERVFLGWDGPCLARAVQWLVERFGGAGSLDLAAVLVAVPGSRAGRRLLELLVQRAEQDRRAWTPPRIMTIGKLPEQLYETRRPFAGNLVQQLAWIEALCKTDPAHLKRLVAAVPAENDLSGWLALAEMLARLHRELAAEAIDFASVANAGSRLPGFREQARWETLAQVQAQYLCTLDGLELWDLQTARLFAIQHGLCRAGAHVVLVGTADLNRQQQLILDQVADRVTSLVFAPQALADRFDEYGCLAPVAWQEAAIDLAEEQIEVVEGPADQAAAVVRAIHELDGRYSAEEIVVGVPDEMLVPYLEQQLENCGLPTRSSAGSPVARSGPYRLLDSLAEYLSGRRYSALASLVRHPAVDDWLAHQGIEDDWLSELDGYSSAHFPAALDGQWLGKTTCSQRVRRVYEAVEALAAGFGPDKRPLGQWGQAIMDVLVQLYGRTPLDQDVPSERTILCACEAIRAVALEYGQIDARLAPVVARDEALRLVLRDVCAEAVPSPADREAVELLGWLELPLDDAPALIVTSVNEGIVPASLNSDLFLPDQLRRTLGIEDNDRRYARDAYALSLLAASRVDVKLIAGRRSAQGDPLAPSRLLFACDEERVVRRVRRFFEERPPRAPLVLPGTLRPGQRQSIFERPRPLPLVEPITSMRVTEFRDYLACPYRYYLRRCLELKPLSDTAEELEGGAFGTLAHDVLKPFGQSELKSSTNADEIFALLCDALDAEVQTNYGRLPRAAIRVQVEQLRLRLKAFARWQAEWAAQGWRIEYVENEFAGGQAFIKVDDQPMFLRGRIDRIDVHAKTGHRVLFDYKTSDSPKMPEQVHRKRKTEWVDLQLPLYRHLAAGLGLEGPMRVGYIALPKDTSKVGQLLADWTDGDYASADQAAAGVVRKVREERFWPPATIPPKGFEELASICMDGTFGAAPCDEDEQGGGEP